MCAYSSPTAYRPRNMVPALPTKTLLSRLLSYYTHTHTTSAKLDKTQKIELNDSMKTWGSESESGYFFTLQKSVGSFWEGGCVQNIFLRGPKLLFYYFRSIVFLDVDEAIRFVFFCLSRGGELRHRCWGLRNPIGWTVLGRPWSAQCMAHDEEGGRCAGSRLLEGGGGAFGTQSVLYTKFFMKVEIESGRVGFINGMNGTGQDYDFVS